MMIGKSVKRLWELYGYDPSEGNADEVANQRIVTEEELDSLTAGYPVFLRNNLDWSFYGLERVLKRNPHITEDWRELVKTFRETSGPRPATLLCKTDYGVVFKSKALIDSHSFKYPELSFALHDLVEALDAITNFDPSLHMSDVLYKEAQRITAIGSKVDRDTNKKIEEEITAKYLNAKHGKKGEIKKGIADRHCVSTRHIDNLIKELKKNK